jgi:putative oxidoreductase
MRAQQYTALLGRVFLASIFLVSAYGKLGNWAATVQSMSLKGMPAAQVFLVGAVALEILGGLFVLFGYRARLGAVGLIIFLIPTTLIFHNFWSSPEAQMMVQRTHFLKNLGIIGGLFMVSAFGPGGLSLDKRNRPLSQSKIFTYKSTHLVE